MRQTFVKDFAAKLIGQDSEHKSRFHSRRGEICAPFDLAAIPALLWARVTKNIKQSPWMAPKAVKELDRLLVKQDILLELGSGMSTAWYAQRVGRVVSLEPNISWAKRVEVMLKHYTNAEVRPGPVNQLFPAAMQELHPSVLIVDHTDEPELSRVDAIRFAEERSPGVRLLVLDDSDRADYFLNPEVHRSFSVKRFSGFRENPLRLTETALLTRNVVN